MAKYELIESLPSNGLAIFNGNDKYCLDFYRQTGIPKRVYSINSPEKRSFDEGSARAFIARNIRAFRDGLEFTIFADNEEQRFKSKLLGKQNVSNILAAVTAAKELGMDLSEIAEAVSEIEPMPHTLELKQGIKETILIDDSYSANFEGVLAALDYLSIYNESKKVIVLHPLIELGTEAQRIHYEIGKKIGKVCDLCILVSRDFSFELASGAVESGMDKKNLILYEKPIAIINKVKNFIKKGDAILVENRVNQGIINNLSAE